MVSNKGRPPVFSDKYMDMLRGIYPEIKTRRGLQNKAYEIAAYKHLRNDEAYSWIASLDGRYSPIVLTELGRLGDATVIKTVAAEICTKKLSVKEAVKAVRALRTGKPARPPANALELTEAIISTIEDYSQTHTGVTNKHARAALENVLYCLE